MTRTLVEDVEFSQIGLLSPFVVCWMSGLSRDHRKTLSYDGAIQWREGSPVHHICQTLKQRYFDPSNYVYALAFDLAFPDLAGHPWNQETKGDIFESILGYAYNHAVRARASSKDFKCFQVPRFIATLIDCFVYNVWWLVTKFGHQFCVELAAALHGPEVALPIVEVSTLSCARAKDLGSRFS
jgi:hypothetical protein